MINIRFAHDMDDMGTRETIMNKRSATRLGIRYSRSNSNLRMFNAQPSYVSGVAHRVNITLS